MLRPLHWDALIHLQIAEFRVYFEDRALPKRSHFASDLLVAREQGLADRVDVFREEFRPIWGVDLNGRTLDGRPTPAQQSSCVPVTGSATDGCTVQPTDGGVESDDGETRSRVNDIDKGPHPDRVLGCKDRPVEFRSRDEPSASAWCNPGDEGIRQAWTVT